MVVQSPFGVALGAWPLQALGMVHPNVNPLCLNIKLDLSDKPRCAKTQQVLVEIGIFHDSPPFGGQVYHDLLPTEIPEGPLEKGGAGGFRR
jgi:hypothetical protein